MAHEFRQDIFFAAHGIPAQLRVPPMCQTISGPLQDQILFLLGSVPLYGFCSTDLLPIPVISATHSGGNRPPVPDDSGRLFRMIPATPSERSDAGVKRFSTKRSG